MLYKSVQVKSNGMKFLWKHSRDYENQIIGVKFAVVNIESNIVQGILYN